MNDFGRLPSKNQFKVMQSAGKKKRSSNSYIGDPQLFRRVDKYLEEKADQDVIDKEAMVEDLRNQYKEYGRRNKVAFRNAVFKAFEIVMQTSMNTVGNASDMDISSEDSDEDIEDTEVFNNDLQNQMQMRAMEDKRNHGPVSYIQVVKKMVNNERKPLSTQELINISSSDDDVEVMRAAPKQLKSRVVLLRKDDLPLPARLNLPPETKIIPAGGLFESKRQFIWDDYKGPKNTIITTKVPRTPPTKLRDFGGNIEVVKSVCELLLHMKHPQIYSKLGITPPRGFLLHGPPGSGKTLLANAIAGELELKLVKVAGPELVSGVSGDSERKIRDLFAESKRFAPCVLFIDEIDSITPQRETAQKDMERRIVSQLLASLDDLGDETRVLVIGATNRPDSLDPAIRRAGRFDREICLGIPDKKSREDILKVLCKNLRLSSNVSLERMAAVTPGYVGADLKALTNQAAIMAVNRIMSQLKKPQMVNHEEKEAEEEPSKENGNITDKNEEKPVEEQTTDESNSQDITISCGDVSLKMIENCEEDRTSKQTEPNEEIEESKVKEAGEKKKGKKVKEVGDEIERPEAILHNELPLSEKDLEDLYIEEDDFIGSLKVIQPSSKREGFATVPDVTWDDIGSLKNIRDQLQMSIMMPVKYPEEFAKLGVSSPAGILLCGPPGCGKTLLAKAVANEANINFISVKGPELLNMYVGESERAVRQCFQRARNSHPCVIFFDELDALCPKRSDNIEGSASSRVVNQLLTEMDGVEGRCGVFLMAATNRPDMVDPAVMRPGRFDKILYVGLPKAEDRVDILKAITKNGTKPPFDVDVSLEEVARNKKCERYTGADLAALVKEASVQALTQHIGSESLMDLVVRKEHISLAFSKIRPSVTEKDHKRYEGLRLQFAAVV